VTGASTIRIGLLLPDVLGTYSDAGNAAVLAARARWRGVPAEILTIHADATPPTGCDVYLIGGGEDTAQLVAADWLRRHTHLHHALDTQAKVLAVCAGLQILGQTMRDRAGRDHPGLGVLDLTTAPGRRRAVGEIITACAIPGVGQLTGFENHQGITTLGPGTASLGTVVTGTGNGTRDRGRPHRPCHRHLPARSGPGPQPGPGRPHPDRHYRHRDGTPGAPRPGRAAPHLPRAARHPQTPPPPPAHPEHLSRQR